jgi:hypothetical protein
MASVACAHRNLEYLEKHTKQLKGVLKGSKVAHAPHPKNIVGLLSLGGGLVADRSLRRSGRTSKIRRRHKIARTFLVGCFSPSCSCGGRCQSSSCKSARLGCYFVSTLTDLPLSRSSFLANLANFATFVPFLQDWQAASNGTFSAVS